MKVYLAGKMTGEPDFGKALFDKYTHQWRACGYEVHNPAKWEDDVPPGGKTWEAYMKRAVGQLGACDAMVVLTNWKQSKGATLEVWLAVHLGMPVWDAITGAEIKLTAVKPIVGPKIEDADWAGTDENLEEIIWAEHGDPSEGTVLMTYDSENMPEYAVECSAEVASLEECVARTAMQLVNGDRQAAYDHPLDNFNRIGSIWSGILGTVVTAEKVALCMVGVKLAREAYAHRVDNLVDGVGYWLTLAKVKDERRRRENP